ncbi:MAG TPA: carbon-nitrogen hydrolase family protein [Candidatus Limnocylindrales bacterium]|nr:carbon-nitrogen hydrolase family protein [Candidatus Limnocylindrales bacterium]
MGSPATPRRPLSVAAAQPACVGYDLAANAAAHAAAVRAAGARVVVFPELSLTGYELDAAAVELDDPRLGPIVEACAETGSVALAGGPVLGDDGRRHLGMLAIDAAGVRVVYRKTFLGGAEPDHFAPGPGAEEIEVDGWRLGLGICKDTRIAEHITTTGALGIDAYAAGMLEAAEDAGVPEERARRIARELGIPVVIASFAGSTGGGYDVAAGGSGIWAADGTELARAGAEVGEVVRATLGLRSAGP